MIGTSIWGVFGIVALFLFVILAALWLADRSERKKNGK